jgi:hypothetical protein
MIVAALYIDPRGPYPKLPLVDCWDAARDARLYAGPWPVVAHPPCGPWSKLRHLYRGNEHDCAPLAVEQVRAFGGVLEHPRDSRLVAHCALPRPGDGLDAHGGQTIEVCQVDWGHVARKRTWLYCAGVALGALTFPPPRVSGFHHPSRRGKAQDAAPPGIKICSAEQRRRTPPAFAEWLVALARTARIVRQPVTYETLATVRLVRNEYGGYMVVIDHEDGSAPESSEGFDTIDASFFWAARVIHESLKRRPDHGA